jgi:hypothetical protein
LLPLLLALQTAIGCATAADCRAQAEGAAARGDYETFHDLAWAAVQKGRRNDPDLMYVLARAQALSGRPGDALVMLRRLAELGVSTDAATSEDFARVRRLKDWPELEARIAGMLPGAPVSGAPDAARVPDVRRAPVAPAAPERVVFPAPAAPLSFDAAGLDPVALAHDAVSRRFVLADRRARRLVVVDEVSRHVVAFVSAESSGFLEELTAVAIDARRGDLWVASAAADGSSSALHKLQLVSGRVLEEVKAPAAAAPVRIADVAVAPDGTIYALDGAGSRLYRLRPNGRALDLVLRLDVRDASAVAAADDKILYVAGAGGLSRVDLASRAAAPVKSTGDMTGFRSLAWRGGALVGVQRTGAGDAVVRVAVDPPGARVRSRTVLATTDRPAIGALGGAFFYYLADQAIHRVPLR